MTDRNKTFNNGTIQQNGITYAVSDQRYTQYVSMPSQQMTSLDEFAGYAIKEEMISDKVYMVLEGSSSSNSDNVVVGPDMPNLDQFNEEDGGVKGTISYTEPGPDETVFYVVGGDNTLHPTKDKGILVSDGLHILDSSEVSTPTKKKRRSKIIKTKEWDAIDVPKITKVMRSKDDPHQKYPLPAYEVPLEKRGLRNKPGCKHCKNAVAEEHSSLISHYCIYCDYGTYEITALNQHIKRQHSSDTKKWFIKCRFCSYQTVCKSNLKYHFKVTHDESNMYSCTFCSFTTNIKMEYYSHVIDEHSGERSVACPYCLYKTSDVADVQKHIRYLHPDQQD